MYTLCRIRWTDDGSELDVIIKANDEFDKYDEMIFFYGLSRAELEAACESGEELEGEWTVVSVGITVDAMI